MFYFICSYLFIFVGIPEYPHDYPELPKHPVPKEDVSPPGSSLYYQPQPQPILQTILQGSMIEMDPPGMS